MFRFRFCFLFRWACGTSTKFPDHAINFKSGGDCRNLISEPMITDTESRNDPGDDSGDHQMRKGSCKRFSSRRETETPQNEQCGGSEFNTWRFGLAARLPLQKRHRTAALHNLATKRGLEVANVVECGSPVPLLVPSLAGST